LEPRAESWSWTPKRIADLPLFAYNAFPCQIAVFKFFCRRQIFAFGLDEDVEERRDYTFIIAKYLSQNPFGPVSLNRISVRFANQNCGPVQSESVLQIHNNKGATAPA